MRAMTMIAVLAAVWTGAACSPTLDWRELRPEGSGIAATFPCKPDRHARALVVGGNPLRMEMLVCSAGGTTFALAFADLDDPATVGPVLAELRSLAAANIAARPGTPSHFVVPGMTPNVQSGRIALVGRLPDGAPVQEQAAFFSRGLRVYQASVIGPKVSDEVAETFIAALKLAA